MANILVLSHYWYPENGVPQRRWTWLSRVLQQQGHSVSVIAPPEHYARRVTWGEWRKQLRSTTAEPELGPSGEQIFRTRYFLTGPSITGKALNQAIVAGFSLIAGWKAERLFENGKPDLLIGTVPALPTAVLTMLLARHLKLKYIIDLRDAWPDLLKQSDDWNEGTGSRSLRERVLSSGVKQLAFIGVEKMINLSLSQSSGIIVTAQSLREQLRKSPHLWRKRGSVPIATVRNVFPVESPFKKTFEESTSDDGLRVLYAGTLGRAQKLSNALLAAQVAQEKGVHIQMKFVGAGVTKEALKEQVKQLGLDVEILDRVPAQQLEEFYQWADVALVHLTDWEPLHRTVPSKTYELISAGVFISGAVAGEAAELINGLEAGDVVAPSDPQALGESWVTLARNRENLRVNPQAERWVDDERAIHAPESLAQLIAEVLEAD